MSGPACEFGDTCWLTAVCQRTGAPVVSGVRTEPRTCPSATAALSPCAVCGDATHEHGHEPVRPGPPHFLRSGRPSRLARRFHGLGPSLPDRLQPLVALVGVVVLAAWPGDPPKWAEWTLVAALFGLWIAGRLILRPWRDV